MIYEFKGRCPVIHASSFIHPQAIITGSVIIGKNCYIGPGAALRGDWGEIIIEDGCNVQENCTIHMFPGLKVHLKRNAHVGHGAIIHGAIIGRNCLIGMNAVILDNVILGDDCIVGALTLIKEGEKFTRRSLIVGNPGKKIKDIGDEMIAWKTEGTKIYQQLPRDCHEYLKPCEPLRKKPSARAGKKKLSYKPWKQS